MSGRPDETAKLLEVVRESQDASMRFDDPGARARARARMLQALDREAREERETTTAPRRTPWAWVCGLAVATACAVGLLFALDRPKPDPSLAYAVDGVEVSASDHGRRIESGDGPRTLAFSDGTTIDLAPHAGVRIEGVRDNGATVILDHGDIELSVHHERDTSWRVAAGPWTVHVTGTVFAVSWEPIEQAFAVAVREGSVRVEGPRGEVARLGAGERLARTLALAEVEAESEAPVVGAQAVGPQVDSSTGSEPVVIDLPTAPGSDGDTPPVPDRPPPDAPGEADVDRWLELYEVNEFDAAWDALAERPGGIHGEVERVDAATVLDLADLARFTKHGDDARDVLRRGRERFPGTSQAGQAAFILGKMASDGGDWSEAAAWLETYLDEHPKGSLTADALARLMSAYVELGQSDDAESAAERYLDRAPEGAHAEQAKSILER